MGGMGMIYLRAKVFIIHTLQRLRILPNVWYASELALAAKRGKNLALLLEENAMEDDNA